MRKENCKYNLYVYESLSLLVMAIIASLWEHDFFNICINLPSWKQTSIGVLSMENIWFCQDFQRLPGSAFKDKITYWLTQNFITRAESDKINNPGSRGYIPDYRLRLMRTKCNKTRSILITSEALSWNSFRWCSSSLSFSSSCLILSCKRFF